MPDVEGEGLGLNPAAGLANPTAMREDAVEVGAPPLEAVGRRRWRGHPHLPPSTRCYSFGLTQVSDHARHALDDWRSPRISGQGFVVATIPLISACAERAGKNVLKTPIGRLLVPGAIVSTNGGRQSYQVSRIFSFAELIVSHAAARGSPPRPNSAVITRSEEHTSQ